jgi:hypothetical protein
MKKLVHYDHKNKQIIIETIKDNEDPANYLKPGSKKDADAEPDPYWHRVGGKWEVVVK